MPTGALLFFFLVGDDGFRETRMQDTKRTDKTMRANSIQGACITSAAKWRPTFVCRGAQVAANT